MVGRFRHRILGSPQSDHGECHATRVKVKDRSIRSTRLELPEDLAGLDEATGRDIRLRLSPTPGISLRIPLSQVSAELGFGRDGLVTAPLFSFNGTIADAEARFLANPGPTAMLLNI